MQQIEKLKEQQAAGKTMEKNQVRFSQSWIFLLITAKFICISQGYHIPGRLSSYFFVSLGGTVALLVEHTTFIKRSWVQLPH